MLYKNPFAYFFYENDWIFRKLKFLEYTNLHIHKLVSKNNIRILALIILSLVSTYTSKSLKYVLRSVLYTTVRAYVFQLLFYPGTKRIQK